MWPGLPFSLVAKWQRLHKGSQAMLKTSANAVITASTWRAFTTHTTHAAAFAFSNNAYRKHTAKYGMCGSWGSIG